MKKKLFPSIYMILATLLGLGCTGWLLSLLFKYYDASSNGFSAPGSALTALGIVLFVLAVAAFLFRWKLVGKTDDLKIMPKAVYGVLAALFLASGVLSVIKLLSTKQYITSTLFYAFALLSTSFSFVVALFFALKLTRFEKKTEQFSLIVPVWLLFMIGSSYFNTAFTYVSFTRNVLNLSLAAMLLFTMAEVREYIGRKYFALLCASSASAIILGTTAIVSRYVFIIGKGATLLFSDCQEIAVFAMLVYVVLSSVYKNHTIEKEPPKVEEKPTEEPPEQ